MSFTASTNGTVFGAGFFLKDDEECIRESANISASHAQAVTTASGKKFVPMGAVIPANSSSAVGILYEDIDVTNGDKPGSIVTKGVVYEDRLPASLQSAAKSAMTGITVITSSPAVTRPDYFEREYAPLTVESAAGTNAGDTAITVTGYSLGTGEAWKYKVGDTAAVLNFGDPLPASGWTTWDGDDDITAATNKKLALVAVSAGGYVIAYGSCTVTAHA